MRCLIALSKTSFADGIEVNTLMGSVKFLKKKVAESISQEIHKAAKNAAFLAAASIHDKIEAHKIKKNNRYTKTVYDHERQKSEIQHLPDYKSK